MGAWGAGTFENDAAADWGDRIADFNDLSYVRSALTAVINAEDDFLDAEVAAEGLAACEVIARLKGNWGVRSPYSGSIDVWVESHPIQPDQDIIAVADSVIERVLLEPSELLELWNEGDGDEWRAAVEDLRSRLIN